MLYDGLFQERMDQEKKLLIREFNNQHPPVIATIGYGSGVIPQYGSDSKDKKEIDIILVVEDLQEWLIQNMIDHPEEFTPSTLRFFKNASLKQLESGAPIVYFSKDSFRGEYIKRGIISKEQFLSSCYERTSSFVPFRLEKVIELIDCKDEEIYQALIYDHQITLMLSLLMLSKEEHNFQDLVTRICSLSYLGDFRMKIHCEDPNKIRNIVKGQFQYFCEDYEKVNFGYYQKTDANSFDINYKRIEEDIYLFPEEIMRLIKSYNLDGTDVILIKRELEEYFKTQGQKENFKQACKGIQTIGVQKSLIYGVRKLKKGYTGKK